MSDDIVIRLREFGDSYGLDYEAADEIERLRAEVDTLSKVIRKLNGDGVIYFRDKAVRGD
jgi:hypothetical protein